MKLTKPKRGERYLNYIGEYCVVKSVNKDVVKIQVAGKEPRSETWKVKDFTSHVYGRFRQVPYPKINRTNIARHLLEYQLNLIGKTSGDAKMHENWFNEWEISQEDAYFFKKYAIPLLKKTFKFSNKKALATFEWFNLQFGLKLKRK